MPLRSPTEGEKRGEGEREMVKNYQKLKKIIITPKCPKTVQKISKSNLLLNHQTDFYGAYEDSSHDMASVTFV